jgi:hypothetical protein
VRECLPRVVVAADPNRLRLRQVRIHLSNDGLLPYLLAYLRDNGCVAELDEDEPAIDATAPELAAVDELRVIRGLTSLWLCGHPTVNADFSDHLYGLGPRLGAVTPGGREPQRGRSGPVVGASGRRVASA